MISMQSIKESGFSSTVIALHRTCVDSVNRVLDHTFQLLRRKAVGIYSNS